jgi:hypothetical protein
MDNTFDIKYQNHFKLIIELKDKIVFEAELNKNDIPFHLDDNPLFPTRYFLLDEDRNRIDNIIKITGIIASTDTIPMADYADSKKVYKIYLYVVILVVILFAVAMIITEIIAE